jgi:hypothetical protein
MALEKVGSFDKTTLPVPVVEISSTTPDPALDLPNNFPDDTIFINANNVLVAANGGSVGVDLTLGVIAIDGGNANGGGSFQPQPNTGTVGLSTRTSVSTSVPTIDANSSVNLEVTGYTGYLLYKVECDVPLWIRIYTDGTKRTDDADRYFGVDPAVNSGVVAEVVTTANTNSILMLPPVIGFNNDSPTTDSIYVSLKNLGTQQSL